jgi:FixJ family two-component response regulator
MKPVENCNAEIVCVVVTGREDSTAKRTSLHLAAIAFFAKPFADNQFLSAVRGALAVQQ